MHLFAFSFSSTARQERLANTTDIDLDLAAIFTLWAVPVFLAIAPTTDEPAPLWRSRLLIENYA